MANVLRHLKILEVSSVDRGAGEGVKIVLMKRDAPVDKIWKSNDELPDAIKGSLPGEAQTVWRKVANQQLADGAGEKSAIKQAWSAVKNGWRKEGDSWVRKDNGGSGEFIDLDAIEATVEKQEIEAMTLEELKKLINEQVTATVTKVLGETIPEAVTKAVTEALDKGKKVKKVKPGSKGRFDSNPDAEHDGGDEEQSAAEEETDAETKKALEIAKLSPEVRKIIDEAEQNSKLVKQFVQKQELEEFGKRAIGMGLKKEDGILLQKAYTGDVASQKVLEERMATVAKARKAQEDTSVIFKEFGTNNGEVVEGGGSALDQMNALAAELRKKDPNLTPAQAFTKVMTDPANVEVASRERQERMAKIHHLPGAA